MGSLSAKSAFVCFRPGRARHIPDAWILRPSSADAAPPVVVVHGITRGVEEMVTYLAPRAEAVGRTVILPHFSIDAWPRYQRAACRDRADWALLRLMEALQREAEIRAGPFDLSGFSGGAQFAHRFAWLYPHMVAQLCLTAPGWWTFPDPHIAWPYGIGSGPSPARDFGFHLRSNARAFLNRRIRVCVGSDDVGRDKNLRQTPEIDRQQGQTRLMRAQRWVAAAEDHARLQGLKPRLSLRVLQGCGHVFSQCVAQGGLAHDLVPTAQTLPDALGHLTHNVVPSSPSHLERNAA